MDNPLHRFVVDQLVPENRQGGGTYALNEDSVSPTRNRRCADGVIREETICTLAKHARFVDPAGNVCTVPLRTGRVFSQEVEAVRYEQIVVADQIRAGSIPLEVCPHTMQYAHLVRGPLVPNPENVIDCGGDVEGCEHMRKVIEDRRAVTRAKWEAEQVTARNLSEVDAKAMMQGVVEAFGDMLMNAQQQQKAGRQNLRGKGEE